MMVESFGEISFDVGNRYQVAVYGKGVWGPREKDFETMKLMALLLKNY
jgi:hypothetical protein